MCLENISRRNSVPGRYIKAINTKMYVQSTVWIARLVTLNGQDECNVLHCEIFVVVQIETLLSQEGIARTSREKLTRAKYILSFTSSRLFLSTHVHL